MFQGNMESAMLTELQVPLYQLALQSGTISSVVNTDFSTIGVRIGTFSQALGYYKFCFSFLTILQEFLISAINVKHPACITFLDLFTLKLFSKPSALQLGGSCVSDFIILLLLPACAHMSSASSVQTSSNYDLPKKIFTPIENST